MHVSASDLAHHVIQQIDKMAERQAKIVCDGTPADWGGYREAVGYLRCAGEMAAFMKDLTKTRGEIA